MTLTLSAATEEEMGFGVSSRPEKGTPKLATRTQWKVHHANVHTVARIQTSIFPFVMQQLLSEGSLKGPGSLVPCKSTI